jgi:hypothetical protein
VTLPPLTPGVPFRPLLGALGSLKGLGEIPPTLDGRRHGWLISAALEGTSGHVFHNAPGDIGHEALPDAAVPTADGTDAVAPAALAALLTAPATAPETLSLKTLGMM